MMMLHRHFQNFRNLHETDLFLKQKLDSHFIRRIENGRHTAAFSCCSIGQRKSRERLGVRCFKGQLMDCKQIHKWRVHRSSFRINEGILDWQLHIRKPELCNHRTIVIFHCGMHNTLRMHNNLNLIKGYVKQPLRFHHFQPLIDEGCRINCHLFAHRPVRMLQRILQRHLL